MLVQILVRMDNIHYTYNRKFEGNSLVLGQKSCGKTTFIQNIAKNGFLRDKRRSMDFKNLFFKKKREKYKNMF